MAEIEFVGTGDAFGSGGRRNTAILVRDRGKTLLLDCGPTTLVGLKQMGIDPREIDAIAISHFHGDHLAGLPFLLLDYLYENERKRPLEIIGPPEIEQRLATLTDDFAYPSRGVAPYGLSFREYTPGEPIKLENFTVTPVPAHHQPDTRPHMLRVVMEDRAVFFTGDTGWGDDLPGHSNDIDLYIAECVFMEEQPGLDFHLNHRRLCQERARFVCERLILTHLGAQVIDALDHVDFDTATDGLKLEI